MANYLIEQETLTNIANSIRGKTGDKNTLSPSEMATAINSISTGADTSDATAAADEIFAGKTAYTANGKTTGTFTIDNELSTQENLLNQLQNALNGKSEGPNTNSIEMCKINLTIPVMGPFPRISEIVYSTIENSQVKTQFQSIENFLELTVDDNDQGVYTGTISVIKTSTICLIDNYSLANGVGTSDNLFADSFYLTDSGLSVYFININEGNTGSIEVY